MDLALNNLQSLISHKIQPANQLTNQSISFFFFDNFSIFFFLHFSFFLSFFFKSSILKIDFFLHDHRMGDRIQLKFKVLGSDGAEVNFGTTHSDEFV